MKEGRAPYYVAFSLSLLGMQLLAGVLEARCRGLGFVAFVVVNSQVIKRATTMMLHARKGVSPTIYIARANLIEKKLLHLKSFIEI